MMMMIIIVMVMIIMMMIMIIQITIIIMITIMTTLLSHSLLWAVCTPCHAAAGFGEEEISFSFSFPFSIITIEQEEKEISSSKNRAPIVSESSSFIEDEEVAFKEKKIYFSTFSSSVVVSNWSRCTLLATLPQAALLSGPLLDTP